MLILPSVLFFVQLFRGSGQEPSYIGVTRCTAADWSIFIALIIVAFAVTLYSVWLQRNEYEYKKSIQYQFVPGDFKCTQRNAFKLPAVAVLGGFLTASTGTGPGPLFNILLVRLNCHPQVATSTGQFLGTFTSFASAVCMLIYQQLDIEYTIPINIFTIIGTLIGINCAKLMVIYSGGSQQGPVFVSVLVIFIVAVSSAAVEIYIMIKKKQMGEEIFTIPSYCEP